MKHTWQYTTCTVSSNTYPNITRNSSNVFGTSGNKSNSVKHTNTLAALIAMMTAGAWVFLISETYASCHTTHTYTCMMLYWYSYLVLLECLIHDILTAEIPILYRDPIVYIHRMF